MSAWIYFNSPYDIGNDTWLSCFLTMDLVERILVGAGFSISGICSVGFASVTFIPYEEPTEQSSKGVIFS